MIIIKYIYYSLLSFLKVVYMSFASNKRIILLSISQEIEMRRTSIHKVILSKDLVINLDKIID